MTRRSSILMLRRVLQEMIPKMTKMNLQYLGISGIISWKNVDSDGMMFKYSIAVNDARTATDTVNSVLVKNGLL